MKTTRIVGFGIGKKGLTQNFFESLEKTFKKHDLIKVSILKSATRNREEVKKIAREICSELKKRIGKDLTAKIIGFTIIIKKWRKLKK